MLPSLVPKCYPSATETRSTQKSTFGIMAPAPKKIGAIGHPLSRTIRMGAKARPATFHEGCYSALMTQEEEEVPVSPVNVQALEDFPSATHTAMFDIQRIDETLYEEEEEENGEEAAATAELLDILASAGNSRSASPVLNQDRHPSNMTATTTMDVVALMIEPTHFAKSPIMRTQNPVPLDREFAGLVLPPPVQPVACVDATAAEEVDALRQSILGGKVKRMGPMMDRPRRKRSLSMSFGLGHHDAIANVMVAVMGSRPVTTY